MIRGAQKHAAETDTVPCYWKGNDLTFAARQVLVTTRPAGMENEDLVFRLALFGETLAALHRQPIGLDIREFVYLFSRQGEKYFELLGEDAARLSGAHCDLPARLSAYGGGCQPKILGGSVTESGRDRAHEY